MYLFYGHRILQPEWTSGLNLADYCKSDWNVSIASRLCMGLCCPGNFTKNVLLFLKTCCKYGIFSFSTCGWSAVNILAVVLQGEKKIHVHTAVILVESPIGQCGIYCMPSGMPAIKLSAVLCYLQQCSAVTFCCIKTKIWPWQSPPIINCDFHSP